jgi:hypothetical protein
MKKANRENLGWLLIMNLIYTVETNAQSFQNKGEFEPQ